MTKKTRDEYNAYMRVYMLKRYHARRAEAIAKLGGKCGVCGSAEALEIDHIDPSTKSFEIARVWSLSVIRFWNEIDKCQLLCAPHHHAKTIRDKGHTPSKGVHGTPPMYRHYKCRCSLCKKAWSDYTKALKKR